MPSWFNLPSLGRSYIARRIEYRQGPSPGEFVDIRDFASGFDLRQQWYDDGASLTLTPTEADATLGVVSTYAAPFELRKLHVIWSQADLAAPTDDARVCTFHLLKVVGGVPNADWVQADFDLVRTTLSTWWTSIADRFAAQTTLDRMKLYKDGPAIEPPQIPVYDADLNIPGTAAQSSLPPQVAISVTEKAGAKRYWGRFFLPSPGFAAGTTYARLDATVAGDIADATDVWYEALKAGGIHPVVYRQALDVRQTAEEKRLGVTPGSLPARAASAWDVESIQVDDVFDVIRSRRWKATALRTQRAIA